jgi:hypothetical protein
MKEQADKSAEISEDVTAQLARPIDNVIIVVLSLSHLVLAS